MPNASMSRMTKPRYVWASMMLVAPVGVNSVSSRTALGSAHQARNAPGQEQRHGDADEAERVPALLAGQARA